MEELFPYWIPHSSALGGWEGEGASETVNPSIQAEAAFMNVQFC